MVAELALLAKVKRAQETGQEIVLTIAKVEEGFRAQYWTMDTTGFLLCKGKVFVPKTCRAKVLREFHNYMMLVYPGSTKVYRLAKTVQVFRDEGRHS